MRKQILIIITLLSMTMFMNCRTVKNAVSGADSNHGKEKAFSSPSNNPIDVNNPFTISFDYSDQSGSKTEMSLEYIYDHYASKYKKDGESDYKDLLPEEIRQLQAIVSNEHTKEYYRDNFSTSSDIEKSWNLLIKQDDKEFTLHGQNVNPKDFPILSGIISFFDYTHEYTESGVPFPSGDLVSFNYRHKGSMRPGGPEYQLTRNENGSYKLVYTNDSKQYVNGKTENKEKLLDSKVGSEIIDMLKAGKVQNYRSYYNAYGVMDGSSWSMSIKFSDGKVLSSGGYMSGPRDDSGLKNTLKYLDSLLK